MKHGSIAHDGTFDEVSTWDPELFTTWKQSMVEMSESETSGSESDVKEERKALKKQVSIKSLQRGNTHDIVKLFIIQSKNTMQLRFHLSSGNCKTYTKLHHGLS